MNTTQAALTAAIAYWANCLGKGTRGQRRMVEQTIRELEERLAAL